MPFYDFQCKKCNHTFERMVNYSAIESVIADPCPNEECGCLGEVVKITTGQFMHYNMPRKPPDDFCNMLSSLKKNTKGAADFTTW